MSNFVQHKYTTYTETVLIEVNDILLKDMRSIINLGHFFARKSDLAFPYLTKMIKKFLEKLSKE